eukprot:2886942-Prymnesium_polylepis.1
MRPSHGPCAMAHPPAEHMLLAFSCSQVVGAQARWAAARRWRTRPVHPIDSDGTRMYTRTASAFTAVEIFQQLSGPLFAHESRPT